MSAIPTNLAIYNRIKEEINKKYKPSAYRSGMLVQKYKEVMNKLGQPAYVGRYNPDSNLARWYRERWLNQRNEVGYKYKSDVYRPTIRISKDTPTTFSELTPQEIAKAKREKARTGRVKRFKE